MDHEKVAAVLRIGELSRRVGVSEHVLRAWETRYGLLRPVRSAGGYRLYSADDQARVARMQAYLGDGLAAAQAAQAAIAAEQPGAIGARDAPAAAPRADLADSAEGLRQALDALDEPMAQSVLDRLLTDFTVETVIREVLMPYLSQLGQRWQQGTIGIAQEHFASNVLRGRLAGLARGWGTGHGPYAILACPPGEEHDLPLLAFGIILNRNGWRIGYLGVNTPIPELIKVASVARASVVVLASTTPGRFEAVIPELAELAGAAPLALAGAGATGDMAARVGARLLTGDPVSAAEHLANP
jgi:MerR family transcriptional regulator, light-induced transcriptional regulator